ncbi:MAG: hypothetical protein DRH23_08540 [Deltaproteobacteria bacterium]|jgi:hypothetical protein|nr:hypothetical protein [Deltaproteobacteria bacterium]RLB48500.1 MAG: hypothetical protein DRH23_08540 [Deltaproteobacteria bacterium]
MFLKEDFVMMQLHSESNGDKVAALSPDDRRRANRIRAQLQAQSRVLVYHRLEESACLVNP